VKLTMRIASILVLTLASTVTSPSANAFLNRDCPNLKKRVTSYQKQSDKAWDNYQSAVGRSQDFKVYVKGTEVINRGLELARLGLLATTDMRRYKKCVANTAFVDKLHYQLISQRTRLDVGLTPYEFPFSVRLDYVSLLKK
jgi:hypothetical protein